MSSEPRPAILSPSVSWPLILRVLLGALFVSTGVGLWYAISRRVAFQLAFPGSVHELVYVALLITGATGLIAIAGLWLWRRWAVILYVGVAVASLCLDVVAEAPLAHRVTVVVSAVSVFLLVYLSWDRFRSNGSVGTV